VSGDELPDVAVLILCAGNAAAWEGDQPVQLRKLPGGETVLERIIRQVQGHGHEPIIITWRDDIKSSTPDLEHYEPARRRTIADTWLHTKELWREQTVILLGDTVYGKQTIKETLAYRGTMKAIGNSAEIFAFTFSANEHDKLAEVLYEVNRDTEKGAPWLIYRRWIGVAYTNGKREAEVFRGVWDRTADIDSSNSWRGVCKFYDKEWRQ